MSYSFLSQIWDSAKIPIVSIFKSTMPKLFGDDETESKSQIFLKNVFEAIHSISCSYSTVINNIFSGTSSYDYIIPDYLSWMAGCTKDLSKTDLAFAAYYNHYIGTSFYEMTLKSNPNTVNLGNKITMSPSTTLQFVKGTYILIKANLDYQWPSSVPDKNFNLVVVDSVSNTLKYYPIIQGLDQAINGIYLNVAIQKPMYDTSDLIIVGLSEGVDIFYPVDSELIGGHYYSDLVEPVDQSDMNNYISGEGNPKLFSNANVKVSNFRVTGALSNSSGFYIKPNWTSFNNEKTQIIKRLGQDLILIKDEVYLYSDQFDIVDDTMTPVSYIEYDTSVIKTNIDRLSDQFGVNQGDFSNINELPEFSIYSKNYLKGGLSQGVGTTDSIKYSNNSWIGYEEGDVNPVGSLFVKEA